MKRALTICVAIVLLTPAAYVNATPVSLLDAIEITKASETDTFNLRLLINEYENWQFYDIGISAEPIEGQQDFAVGEYLVSDEDYNPVLRSMWLWDWAWNGMEFKASQQSGDPIGAYPTDVPLFSFKYTGVASEFIIYNADVSLEVPVGTIAIPVPEPATLAILGLGGLLLRRRMA